MKTKQPKLELVKGGVVVVGVDIGKIRHYAAIRVRGDLVMRKIVFDNNRAGFELLSKKVAEQCEKHGLKRVVLGLEPTGHYWQALGYWWEENQGPVVLINPMHTNRAKELEDNSPLKSDAKDAEVISGLVAEGKYLECHLPRGVFATLRDLVMQRARACSCEARIKRQLHQAVDRIFPELGRVFCNLNVKSYRELLMECSQPAKLATMSAEKLGKRLWKSSRGQLGKSRADQIIGLARESVGITEGAEAISSEIKRLIGRLETMEAERSRLEADIERCLAQTPGAGLLLTIPDFGPMTVAAILAHSGDLSNYQHPDQVIKLAGLNLFEISSGQRKGRVRITKRGRPHLRKVLYMAALRASRPCGSFHYYYARLVARGVAPKAVLVAVMRKILTVSWTLVKKAEEFDAATLKRNSLQAA